ncbi:MAG TPA: type II toxin-antitoxin system VapC family toxin [Thermohalobaculum sp.]|nr:type II toxin-antitoxin system VapC family toxin [Thermohalobaculum sp.]
MTSLLLDTCALIWIAAGDPISEEAQNALREASEEGRAVCVSPISAWEVGLLVARGRLALSMPPQAWLDAFLAQPGAELAPMPVDTLVDSSFLPGSPPRDPADRIVLATARASGMRIMTRDRAMLDYAQQGHAWAMEC